MRDIKEILCELREIASNPGGQLQKALKAGKKAIGVLPYFCPEELVDAAGMVPFGIWGADTQALEAKRYFPAFICSILQTALELGIRGSLNGLSAVMIPATCDSLKGMGANWRYGVKSVPVIDITYAQNRKTKAGVEFTAAQFRKVRDKLSEISGREITDGDISNSIAIYNKNRAALRAFTKAAALHYDVISPADRNAVIKAGYFMPKSEHTDLVEELNSVLGILSSPERKKIKIVTTGILADSPVLLGIFSDNNICITEDQIAHESEYFRKDTPLTADPFAGMAERIGNVEGCSFLYDPGKKRVEALIKLVRETGANGVIYIQTKFCDPEEYDYVPMKERLAAAGIPLLMIETDRQSSNYEQARSAVEAFAEMLN